MKLLTFLTTFFLCNLSFAQLITWQEIDSLLYLGDKGNNLQFFLTSDDLSTTPSQPWNIEYAKKLSLYLEKNPKNTDSLFTLYRVQKYLKLHEQAQQTLNTWKNFTAQLLTKNPKSFEANYSAFHYHLTSKNAFIAGNYLDTLLRYHPDSIKTFEAAMSFFLAQNDLLKVKKYAYDLLAKEPKHPDAIFYFASVEYFERLSAGLIDDLTPITNFLQKEPNNPQLNVFLWYFKAFAFFFKAQEYGFGELSYHDWHLPRDLKPLLDTLYTQWNNVLPTITNKSTAYSLLLILNLFEKDTLKAKQNYLNARNFDPYFTQPYYNYYLSCLYLNNYNACIRIANDLVSIDPSEKHYLMMAKPYLFLNKPAQVLSTLQKIKNPKEASTFAAFAQYYLKVRDLNNANLFLQKAKDTDPKDPDYNFTMALVALLKGDKTDAKYHISRFLEYFPNDDSFEFLYDRLK